MNEVEIMKQIDHPHIVKIYEYFETEHHIFIVMELLEGGELFERIQNEKTFDEKAAKKIIKEILEAINYLHIKNIVHRDIKPENILFSKNGVLKIADFGTSKFFIKSKMKNTHGTPYYIAPEVLDGNYNEKCDVWSVGVILYILLSGYPPFYGNSDEEIMGRVTKGKYDFKWKTFDNVSSNAKNLIKKML